MGGGGEGKLETKNGGGRVICGRKRSFWFVFRRGAASVITAGRIHDPLIEFGLNGPIYKWAYLYADLWAGL